MIGRMRKAADGAALATETRAKVTVLASTRDPIPNDALGRVLQKELERVGPPRWDERDGAFAKALQKEVGVEPLGGEAPGVLTATEAGAGPCWRRPPRSARPGRPRAGSPG